MATFAPRARHAAARPEQAPVPEAEVAEADLSTMCPSCTIEMYPEHAHYRCPVCGYRDSSSF
jgi:hypothetical protein